MVMSLALMRVVQIIQDLVLESKRNSRVQSKAEGTLASVEKKSQETQSALDSARAEVSRLKVRFAFHIVLVLTAYEAHQELSKSTAKAEGGGRAFGAAGQKAQGRVCSAAAAA